MKTVIIERNPRFLSSWSGWNADPTCQIVEYEWETEAEEPLTTEDEQPIVMSVLECNP